MPPVVDNVVPPVAPRRARMLSIKVIRTEICPAYFRPLPCEATLVAWFKAAKIPRFKANATAKAGGGRGYYRSDHVERWFNQRAGL